MRFTGELYKTYCESENSGLKFAEIIDAHNVRKVVLSSMCVDWDWLCRELPDVPTIVIENYSLSSSKCGIFSYSKRQGLKVIHPKFPKNFTYGCMHAKIFILKFDGFLRVGISSGNLMPHDYELVQNIIFLQDIPFSEDPVQGEFHTSFIHFLNELSVPRSFIDQIAFYDWSIIKAKFVSSIPTWNNPETGYLMLKNSITSYLVNINSITVEHQATSFGRMSKEYMNQFLKVFDGVENIEYKYVYPSLTTVLESDVGPGHFGTIFLARKDFNSQEFPREFLYDCVSMGKSRAIHAKQISVYTENELLFCYAGSHNYSMSSWGTWTKTGKFLVRNYEAGVVLPKGIALYQRPVRKYSNDEDPWV